MGHYPLSYQTMDRIQLREQRQELTPKEHRAERQGGPLRARGPPGAAMEEETEEAKWVGVMVWKTRNGRLHLMDVLKTRAVGTWCSELHSQVIWKSIQDGAGNFCLVRLEDAIREAQSDLQLLVELKKDGRSGEASALSRFHYHLDEVILRLTLDQLMAKRKMVIEGVDHRTCVRGHKQAAEGSSRTVASAPVRQTQVIWESVQDGAGKFNVDRLEEAIWKVEAELKGDRRGEASTLGCFHCNPHKAVLRLTLEQVQVPVPPTVHLRGYRQAAEGQGGTSQVSVFSPGEAERGPHPDHA